VELDDPELVPLPTLGGGNVTVCGAGALVSGKQHPPIGQLLSPVPQTYGFGQQTRAAEHSVALGPQSACSMRPPQAANIAIKDPTATTQMPCLARMRISPDQLHGSDHGLL
jgi:hypothetical protein